MTENFESQDDSFRPDQLDPTWVKVSLEFGPLPVDFSEDDTIAERLEQVLDRMHEDDEEGALNRALLLQKFKDMTLTVEGFEKYCASGFDPDQALVLEGEQAQTVEVPESELVEDSEDLADSSALDLTPESQREQNQASFLDLLKQGVADAAGQGAEDEHDLFLETTSEEVVEELTSYLSLRDEVIVLEHDLAHVNFYVLCLADDNSEQAFTAVFDDAGKLVAGEDFEDFLQETLDQLPVRGATSASEDSFIVRGPVTYLGEEVALNPDYQAVALVEMPVKDLLWKSREAGLTQPICTMPEEDGWTYIISDAQTVLEILGFIMKPAILVQHADTFAQLTFIMPGSQGAWKEQTLNSDSWAGFLTKVAGEYQDSGDSGAVVNLVWGAPKRILQYVKQGSEAQDMLWELPGLLPEPLLALQKNDEVENLTWIYGLDEGATRRVRQYVEDSDAEIGMESVLQLLDISADLMNLSLGYKSPDSFEGFRVWSPEMSLNETVNEALHLYPNGKDPVSQVQRTIFNNPWIYLAEGAVNLGVSGLLAARARHQISQGKSGQNAATAAALLATMGLAEIALSAVQHKVKNAHYGVLTPDEVIAKEPHGQWFQDLKEQVEQEKNKEAGIVHTSQSKPKEPAAGKLGRAESDAQSPASTRDTPAIETSAKTSENTRKISQKSGPSASKNQQQSQPSLADQALDKAKGLVRKLGRKFF